jgi:hypothetical protein
MPFMLSMRLCRSLPRCGSRFVICFRNCISSNTFVMLPTEHDSTSFVNRHASRKNLLGQEFEESRCLCYIVRMPPTSLHHQIFGRLLVIRRAPRGNRKSRGQHWLCNCICGNSCIVRQDGLKSGNAKSCGCLQREAITRTGLARATHGHDRVGKRTRIYRIFSSMQQRCENPNNKSWKNYGARGIKFCFKSFEQFLEIVNALGPKPTPKHTFDRINNEGHYEAGNLRWATPKEQANNRRNTECARLARIANMKKARAATKQTRLANL